MTSKTTDERSLAELEAAIREGDETITSVDLAAARDREHLAGLHDEAATYAAERAAAAERSAAVEALRADVVALAAPSDVEDASAALDAAVQAYAAVVEAHNDRVAPLVARAVALGLRGNRVEAPVRLDDMGHGALRTADVWVGRRDGHREIEHVVRTALEVHGREQARARKAAEPAAPPIPMRYFRSANGVGQEHPADRPLPYGVRRAVELGDLVEVFAGDGS